MQDFSARIFLDYDVFGLPDLQPLVFGTSALVFLGTSSGWCFAHPSVGALGLALRLPSPTASGWRFAGPRRRPRAGASLALGMLASLARQPPTYFRDIRTFLFRDVLGLVLRSPFGRRPRAGATLALADALGLALRWPSGCSLRSHWFTSMETHQPLSGHP